jgi:two-component system, sporulation sensor kinase D
MNRTVYRWIIIVSSFLIISLILWNTYIFFQKVKIDERVKMQTWSVAQSDFLNSLNDLDSDVNAVTSIVLTDTTSTTPMIMIGESKSLINLKNIDTTMVNDVDAYLKKLQEQFTSENLPIEVTYKDNYYGTIYYGNSEALNKLKYYPLALLLIIFLFCAVVYFFYKSSKTAAQNKLWSGMAKETAHQIGTPLSSLIGWIEILKTEHVDPSYIEEMEKDISRLQTITERFSKIGSLPTLEPLDIVTQTEQTFLYLTSRLSKLVEFTIELPEQAIMVNLNEQLHSWTIENLLKNGVDAMKGKGKIHLKLWQIEHNVFITISDTGKGIPKNKFNKIFEPGYTTKKRGWGLGLSLTRRIVEDFHNGNIKVETSELNKGTIFKISYKSL